MLRSLEVRRVDTPLITESAPNLKARVLVPPGQWDQTDLFLLMKDWYSRGLLRTIHTGASRRPPTCWKGQTADTITTATRTPFAQEMRCG